MAAAVFSAVACGGPVRRPILLVLLLARQEEREITNRLMERALGILLARVVVPTALVGTSPVLLTTRRMRTI